MIDGAVFRYAMVGLLNTAVGYGVILGLQSGLGMAPRAANLAGFCLGWVLSYVLNRRFAFRHQRAHGTGLALFAFGAGLCWCVNAAALHGVLQFIQWPASVAQAVAVASYTITFYFWNRHVVFPGR